MKRFIALFGASLILASGVSAGKIEKACKASERRASAQLCSCIQQVANQRLSGSDQVLAAKFFADPDLAQATRQSDDKRKESFWKRYKVFGAVASRRCS